MSRQTPLQDDGREQSLFPRSLYSHAGPGNLFVPGYWPPFNYHPRSSWRSKRFAATLSIIIALDTEIVVPDDLRVHVSDNNSMFWR